MRSTKSKTSPGRSPATLSRASARTRGSSAATMRGVKALITSLRWRLCSGGSIRMIDGATSCMPISVPASRAGISKSCVPCAEEKVRGRREISLTSACRVAHQNRPPAYQCSGSSARRRRNAEWGSPR